MSSASQELYRLREVLVSVEKERLQYINEAHDEADKGSPGVIIASFVIGMISLCAGVSVAPPLSYVLMGIGAVGLTVFIAKFGMIVSNSSSALIHLNSFDRMEETALEAYYGALEREAEAHGIDEGSIQPRVEETVRSKMISSFFATRNGVAVSLDVSVKGEEVILLANGTPLAGAAV